MPTDTMQQKAEAVKRLTCLENQYARQVMAFRQLLREVGPENVVVILLDIGKNVHWLMIQTAAGDEVVAPQRLLSNRNGLAKFLQIVAEVEELILRQEVSFVRAQASLLADLERLIRQLLERLWPGALVSLKRFRQAHPHLPQPSPIIQTRPLQRQTLRILLEHCPNPYDLQALSDQEILALYRKNGARAG